MQCLYRNDAALLSDRRGLTFLNAIQRYKKLRGRKKENITTMTLKDNCLLKDTPQSAFAFSASSTCRAFSETRKRAR